jgi:hypothetical protein
VTALLAALERLLHGNGRHTPGPERKPCPVLLRPAEPAPAEITVIDGIPRVPPYVTAQHRKGR